MDSDNLGTVYLIHLETKIANHAQHYVGWAKCLEKRLAHHKGGSGAKLLREANRLGIPYHIVKTWNEKDRHFERAVKNRKKASLFCPVCNQRHEFYANSVRIKSEEN